MTTDPAPVPKPRLGASDQNIPSRAISFIVGLTLPGLAWIALTDEELLCPMSFAAGFAWAAVGAYLLWHWKEGTQ